MSSESDDGRVSPFPDGFVGPIAGLLSLLFAVLAGATAYPAVSGAAGGVAVPVSFGVASVAFLYLRQRYG